MIEETNLWIFSVLRREFRIVTNLSRILTWWTCWYENEWIIRKLCSTRYSKIPINTSWAILSHTRNSSRAKCKPTEWTTTTTKRKTSRTLRIYGLKLFLSNEHTRRTEENQLRILMANDKERFSIITSSLSLWSLPFPTYARSVAFISGITPDEASLEFGGSCKMLLFHLL